MEAPQQTATVTDLVRSLIAGSYTERAAASMTLKRLGAPAVEPLLIALRDSSPLATDARPTIIETLGALGDMRALASLLAELRSPRADVRQATARALALLGNPAAIPALIDLFREDERADGDEAGVVGVWEEAASALASFGDAALAPLCDALGDTRANVRAWSVVALGRLRDGRALGSLVRMLADPAATARAYAADALASMGDSAAFPALAQMVRDDPDPFARGRAAYALATFAGSEVVDALLPALRDPDAGVRCAVAYAIGCSGDRRATGILISLLSDCADDVREAAVLRLGEIGDEQVARTLEPLTFDQTSAEGVRAFAQAAVERIRSRS